MLRTVSITDLRDARFLWLYNTAFPSDEHIPPHKLYRLFGHGGRLILYYDADTYVGFCLTYEHDRVLYIAYIAIMPQLRGMGYGSDLLETVVSNGKYRGCFLTAECLEGKGRELRQRSDRRRFYRRNGWKQTGTKLFTKGTGLEVYELDSVLNEDEVLGTLNRFYECIDGIYRS